MVSSRRTYCKLMKPVETDSYKTDYNRVGWTPPLRQSAYLHFAGAWLHQPRQFQSVGG